SGGVSWRPRRWARAAGWIWPSRSSSGPATRSSPCRNRRAADAPLRLFRLHLLAHPGRGGIIAVGAPAFGQVGDLGQAGVALQDLAQSHDAAVTGAVRGAAEELPVPVLVVADQQDRVVGLQHWPGREGGAVLPLVERPGPFVG